MATITKHYCDRCNALSEIPIRRYSLVYNDQRGNTNVHCTRDADLCEKCHFELEDVLKSFYPAWVYERHLNKKTGQ